MAYKSFISGHELVFGADGNPVRVRLQVTVWEGDERDVPGMKDLGSEILEFPVPLDRQAIIAAGKAAIGRLKGRAGVGGQGLEQQIEAINKEIERP